MNDLFEYHRVHVLSQHVQQEKVAHLSFSDDYVNALFLDQPEPYVQQIGSHSWRNYDDQSIEDHHERQEGQQEEPEPQEDIDLLIDDVDG